MAEQNQRGGAVAQQPGAVRPAEEQEEHRNERSGRSEEEIPVAGQSDERQ